MIMTVLLVCLYSVPRRVYPYSTYVGYPLTIYDNPYNVNLNKTSTSCHNARALIVVHSKVTNFMKRSEIRKTWANRALMSRFGFKVVFFLGKPFGEDIQSMVDEEISEFEDIVQGSFYDSYLNITHKAVLVLRWITEYCREPKTVVKVDDDVFVNVFGLYHSFVPFFGNATNKIWCEVKPPFTHKIHRIKGTRHRISDHEFKGYSYYPLTSCRGYFVVITQDSVRKMYEAAKQTPFFWLDDIYLYGIIVNSTRVELVQIRDNLDDRNERYARQCFESKTYACPLLAVLLDSPKGMETLWAYSVEQMNTLKRKLSQQ